MDEDNPDKHQVIKVPLSPEDIDLAQEEMLGGVAIHHAVVQETLETI